MKKRLLPLAMLFGFATNARAQSIPKELWGKWTVRREISTTTIACWGDAEAKKLVGTELEYSARVFRWGKIVTNNPTVDVTAVTASQFRDDNSGGSASSSQITFRQLGIKADKATQVVIHHPDGSVTGATTEIPGDRVLIKQKSAIVFSVCGVYFDATRNVASPQPAQK